MYATPSHNAFSAGGQCEPGEQGTQSDEGTDDDCERPSSEYLSQRRRSRAVLYHLSGSYNNKQKKRKLRKVGTRRRLRVPTPPTPLRQPHSAHPTPPTPLRRPHSADPTPPTPLRQPHSANPTPPTPLRPPTPPTPLRPPRISHP